VDTTIVRERFPEVRSGDPLSPAAAELKRRVSLALEVLSDPVCAYCGAEESGHGEKGELCEQCAGVL
jgi:hypothetical protein